MHRQKDGKTPMIRKLAAEAFGTFWLVFGGCGSAVLAAGFPELGIGFVGVSLAFGLTVLTMAYAVGHISGGHFNPAVSLGLAVGGRFAWSEMPFYWAAQIVGGVLGALLLFAIASGAPGWTPGGFASNGFGELSPGGYGITAALLIEVVLTAGFLIVILGATSPKAPGGFAPISIGLCLTLIHLISIPVTNTSVNPARSTAVALFAETGALGQLWLFWVAPLVGAAVGALIWTGLLNAADPAETPTGAATAA
jgi:aquaporin Z